MPLPALEGSTRVCGYYGYVFVKRGRTWKRQHVEVWESANGPVPRGYVVHHKDEDKTNNLLTNLELMTRAEHARLHSTGTARTEEVKRAMSEKARIRNLEPAYNAMIRERALAQHAAGTLKRRSYK